MRIFASVALFFCTMHTFLLAIEPEDKDESEKPPWFIGTLLAQYGQIIPKGSYVITASPVVSRVYGIYDGHSHLRRGLNLHQNSLLLSFETGLSEKMDVTMDTGSAVNRGGHKQTLQLIDTQIYWSAQLLTQKKETRIPDLRLMIGENLPTGKFDRLDPAMKGADVTGVGDYSTLILIVYEKIHCWDGKHPYKWNVNLTVEIPTRVSTSGLSFYGGGPGVKGIAYPGIRYFANLSFEYKFSKHWGWGMDINYIHQDRSDFTVEKGTPLFVGLPSIDSLALAPEIEYDFSDSLAVMAGFWYTVWGRNALAFFSGFFECAYFF